MQSDIAQVPDMISELADGIGGTVREVGIHPGGGSGFAVLSLELPKDHWLYTTTEDGFTPPAPWPLLYPGHTLAREYLSRELQPGVQYGIKTVTYNGREDDFDPDAMVNQILNGIFGVHTSTGRSTSEEDQRLFDTPNPGSLKDVLIKTLILAIDEGQIDRDEVLAALEPSNIERVAEEHKAALTAEQREYKRKTFLEGLIGWEGMDTDPDIADLWKQRYPNGYTEHWEDKPDLAAGGE